MLACYMSMGLAVWHALNILFILGYGTGHMLVLTLVSARTPWERGCELSG